MPLIFTMCPQQIDCAGKRMKKMTITRFEPKTDLVSEYQYRNRKMRFWFFLVLLLLLGVASVSCCMGVSELTPGRIFATWVPGIDSLGFKPLTIKEQNVLFMLRLPRIAGAIVAGAGLGISGAGMQAITGNQMASPFTTGISGAAAFGAAMIIVFGGIPVAAQKMATVLAAFIMAALCTALVYGMANYHQMKAETLVLTGIALNYLFSAMNSTMQFIANEEQLPAIIHWTFGSLTGVGWNDIGIMSVIFLAAYPVFRSQAWAFNLLDAGEDETAKSLGIPVRKTRLLTGIFGALLTAAVVSFTGIIGFVGLVAPHTARLLAGGDYRNILPFSAVGGALLVLSADTIGRNAFSPTTIPVGIVVSYVGVPMFLYLVLGERRLGHGRA